MARAWRIEYENALYHVLSRGNAGRPIVSDDHDRQVFLNTLVDMSQRFEIDIFAYVLMDNHYHILMRTRRANLSRSMQWFGATYTKRFNIRHLRKGHLFQGRFKSMLVENDGYLLQLSYYIHRNPLRAGMIKRLADYEWSSYRDYAYGGKIHRWLNTQLILSQLSNVANRHMAYRRRAQKYSKEEQRIWEDFRYGTFFGTQSFVEKLKNRYLPERPDSEIPQQRQANRDIDLEALVQQAGKILNCNPDNFRKAARISQTDKRNRDLLLYFLWQTSLFTNQQIGRTFGLTYSAVSHRVRAFKALLANDSSLQGELIRIKSLIKI